MPFATKALTSDSTSPPTRTPERVSSSLVLLRPGDDISPHLPQPSFDRVRQHRLRACNGRRQVPIVLQDRQRSGHYHYPEADRRSSVGWFSGDDRSLFLTCTRYREIVGGKQAVELISYKRDPAVVSPRGFWERLE